MSLKIGDKVRIIDAPKCMYEESIGKEGIVKWFDSDTYGETVDVKVDDELWVVYKNQLEKIEDGGRKAGIVFVAQYPEGCKVTYDNRTERKYKKAPKTVELFIKRPDIKVTRFTDATYYNDIVYRKALHE